MSRKAALLFAAAALFLLGVIVPPFQNPDEPQHFAVAVFYARGASGEGAERAAVESGVLRMMDRANWWRLVGIGRPQPLPRSLSEVEFLMEGMGTSSDFRARLMNFDLWHRLAGTAMRPVAGWGLERLYYLARAASAIFLIGTFFLLWKAFEILGGLFGEGARLGFYLVFFLPQFWLMGTAVSPDAFVVLLCAAFFYGAARLLAGTKEGRRGAAGKRGGMTVGRLGLAALVVFLPIVAVLTDRSAFVLVPAAILAAVLFVRRENWQTVVPWMLIGAIGAILAVYFAALRSPFLAERIYLSVKALAAGGGAASLAGILDLSGFARMFWGFTADGLLLKFGWLVFGVSKAIYWAWRILLVVAGAGLIVRLVKWAKARMRDEGGEEKAGEGEAKNGGAAGSPGELEVGRGGRARPGFGRDGSSWRSRLSRSKRSGCGRITERMEFWARDDISSR